MTLEDLLAKVGLKEKVQVFKDEQIDMESLVCIFNSWKKKYTLCNGGHAFYDCIWLCVDEY